MGEAVERLDFILSGVLRVIYYRSLHMVSVPHNIGEVLAYAKENEMGEGQFGGKLTRTYTGLVWDLWRWNGVVVGKGLTMDVWIVGFPGGAQTGLARTHFWMGNFSPRSVFPLGVLRPADGVRVEE
ncbi:MAG: hypothetical protein ACREN5_07375 [Gemmatimonadales bacterium]